MLRRLTLLALRYKFKGNPLQFVVSFINHTSHDDVIKWNKIRVTGHLCEEFTGHRWIPRTKASDAELWCFLFKLRPNKRLSKQWWSWRFETPSWSLWHCNHCNDIKLGQAMELRLSCYMVLLLIDSKTGNTIAAVPLPDIYIYIMYLYSTFYTLCIHKSLLYIVQWYITILLTPLMGTFWKRHTIVLYFNSFTHCLNMTRLIFGIQFIQYR